MNTTLLHRLADHEDNFVERKTEAAANGDEIRKAVVSFANTVPEHREAVLFIGVTDDGSVVGVTDPDGMQKTVRRACERCYPRIAYTAEVLTVDEKSAVAVVVAASKNRPHFTGPVYVRVGSESVEASKEQFEALILSRNDKVRAILEWKGPLVTVRARGKKLGDSRLLGDKYYWASHECRIESCDAHVLKMYDLSTFSYVSEPLKNVTIAWDDERKRLALDVQAG